MAYPATRGCHNQAHSIVALVPRMELSYQEPDATLLANPKQPPHFVTIPHNFIKFYSLIWV